ncbi:Mini-ribonuclease 3 [Clostridiales bacterium CHKCI001]|nr:Mini-ribonuclease 3 [Clostridiales bacterium CHKCI001]
MEEGINNKETIDFVEAIKTQFHLKPEEAALYSPLVLAYLGDCVYEIILRTVIVCRGNTSVNNLNKKVSYFAKATTQSKLVKQLMNEFTEEEKQIFKRGRNAKSVTIAKHASMTDYRMATGWEALVGYLYLKGEYERLVTLTKLGIQCLENENS